MNTVTHLPGPQYPRESGLHFLASSFHGRLEKLVDFAHSTPRTTVGGVLYLRAAREAYDLCGLWGWDRAAVEWVHGIQLPPRERESVRVRCREGWRDPRDCLALDRLWVPATMLHLIELRSGRAHPQAWLPTEPEHAEEAAHLAMNLLLALCLWAKDAGFFRPLPTVLLLIAGPTVAPRPIPDLCDAWYHDPANSTGDRPRITPRQAHVELMNCLAVFRDTGLWIDSQGTLMATELGLDFCRVLTTAIDAHFFAATPDEVRSND